MGPDSLQTSVARHGGCAVGVHVLVSVSPRASSLCTCVCMCVCVRGVCSSMWLSRVRAEARNSGVMGGAPGRGGGGLGEGDPGGRG